MGKIEKILKKGPVEGQTTEVYPVTSTKAVYDENNKRLDNIITGLQESVYLKTPIPISTDNTTESIAQNVKNIADYVEKAKAAGIEDVNGMAVTCLIDNDYSGVGYFYPEDEGGPYSIFGVIPTDDLYVCYIFRVFSGTYDENSVLVEGSYSIVTSSMLAQGARRPIILTPDTTEVDEETYQKLLSDDVDVLFKSSNNFSTLTFKVVNSTSLGLVFTSLSLEGGTGDDLWLYGFEVSITKDSPHNCTINNSCDDTLSNFLGLSSFINKSTLSPVLQEIDLTGTDEDRKAKLDQFETDWKALTGADNLDGARFVGSVGTPTGDSTMVFTWNEILTGYTGVGFDDISSNYKCTVYLSGAIYINPLFSHLEAITIKTGNTPDDKAANVAAIKAYVDNLQALGVNTTKGFMVSVNVGSGYYGYMASHYVQSSYFLSGTIFKNNAGENYVKNITINPMGKYDEIVSTTS